VHRFRLIKRIENGQVAVQFCLAQNAKTGKTAPSSSRIINEAKKLENFLLRLQEITN